MNWILLENNAQIEEIVELSKTKLVLVFKHSTRCIVSKMALKNFESHFKFDELIATYFLDLLENRNLSNAIASRFCVVHQSPQIIVIKNGKSIYDASHENIDAIYLDELV